jgi:hypothetical protein
MRPWQFWLTCNVQTIVHVGDSLPSNSKIADPKKSVISNLLPCNRNKWFFRTKLISRVFQFSRRFSSSKSIFSVRYSMTSVWMRCEMGVMGFVMFNVQTGCAVVQRVRRPRYLVTMANVIRSVRTVPKPNYCQWPQASRKVQWVSLQLLSRMASPRPHTSVTLSISYAAIPNCMDDICACRPRLVVRINVSSHTMCILCTWVSCHKGVANLSIQFQRCFSIDVFWSETKNYPISFSDLPYSRCIYPHSCGVVFVPLDTGQQRRRTWQSSEQRFRLLANETMSRDNKRRKATMVFAQGKPKVFFIFPHFHGDLTFGGITWRVGGIQHPYR